MKYDAEFCQQIRVSDDAKRQCLVLITKIIQMAISARNYGLLSLGKHAEENPSFLMRKGLELALDGVNGQTARTILELYIFTEDYTGQDLLERCIIMEGVIGIIEGIHPKLLKEMMLAFLGESGHVMYQEEFESREKKKLDAYLKEVIKKPAGSDMAARLGKEIESLDDSDIKRFLQIVNIDDLAKTVKDLKGQVQIRLFRILPERGARLLLEAVEQLNSIDPSEIQQAQNKVAALLTELEDQDWI